MAQRKKSAEHLDTGGCYRCWDNRLKENLIKKDIRLYSLLAEMAWFTPCPAMKGSAAVNNILDEITVKEN